MRTLTLVVLLILSGCASKATEQKVLQHEQILSAMVNYFGSLQEQGVLPKPEQKPEGKES